MTSNAIESTESAASASPDSPSAIASEKFDVLADALSSDSLKKQLQAIRELAGFGEVGDRLLVTFVKGAANSPTAAHGSAYQALYKADSATAKAFVAESRECLVAMPSACEVDYQELQSRLLRREYQAADKLTAQKLCELAGESALKRKWVYFTEVSQLPATDLKTIDTLWRLYSEDKFGWSKQRELWLRLGQDWERLWTQLTWKSGEGTWTRYPSEFIWDLSAPVGHLPLSNQLRGVRVMDSLLCHPAWAH